MITHLQWELASPEPDTTVSDLSWSLAKTDLFSSAYPLAIFTDQSEANSKVSEKMTCILYWLYFSTGKTRQVQLQHYQT